MADSIRVLHVEDDPEFAAITAEMLERESDRLDVVTEEHPEDALATLADDRSFDCVVSDYDMPQRNGIELLEVVRERFEGLPFILFTGKGSEEIASEAISAGVTDYLQKEGTLDQYTLLANRVENAVAARDASRDVERRIREYRTLVESAPVPMAVVDEGGTVLYLNESGMDALGVDSPAEARGRSVASFVYPDDRDERRERIERAVTERQASGVKEYRLELGDGEVRTVRGSVVPVTFDGEPAAQLVFMDVTSQHEHTGQLRRLHRGTRELLNAADRDEVIELVTTLAEDVLGYEYTAVRLLDEEVLAPAGMTDSYRELLGEPESYPVDGDSPHARVLASGEAVVFDDVRAAKDGRDRDPARSAMYLPLGGHGVVTVCEPVAGALDEGDVDLASVLLANAVAVLERLEQDREMAEVRERLQAVFDGSTDMITLVDGHGEIQYQSPAVADVLGYDPAEMVGEVIFEYVHPDDREPTLAQFAAALEGTDAEVENIQFRCRHADGSWVWLEARASVEETRSQEGYVVTSRDVTERRARARQLERERGRFLALFENFPEPTLSYRYEDGEPIIRSVNKAFVETFGYDAEEAVGSNVDELIVPAERMTEAKVIDEEVAEGQILDRRVRRKTAFGEREFTFRNIPYANGDSVDGFAVYNDVTERVEREEALRRENERLDEFASIVAHDLRNPLNVASTRTGLAIEECNSEHLEHVQSAHERMTTLLEDTLALARQGEMVSDREPLRIERLVTECQRMLETEGATIEVVDDVVIHGDRDRLKQAFENLLSNAIIHSGPDAHVRIGALEDGFYVEDDGPGIPSDDREKIFEPGVTTNDDGTGFGLAIVSRIVEAHGWEITVRDGDEGGARFEITGVDFTREAA